MFGALVNVILPVVLVASVGVVLARRFPIDIDSVNKVSLYGFTPALAYATVVTTQVSTQDSLRLEKGYGVWSLEFSTTCTPVMAGLERFVAAAKGDFIGREAFLVAQAAGPGMKLVLLQVESPEADATGYEPIHREGQRIGYVTSGAYGHHVRQSLALAYVDTEWCETSDPLSVTILGTPRAARILRAPPYDPAGSKLRG